MFFMIRITFYRFVNLLVLNHHKKIQQKILLNLLDTKEQVITYQKFGIIVKEKPIQYRKIHSYRTKIKIKWKT